MIPGLFEAEFVRYGVMHRNTFINSQGCSTTLYGEGCGSLYFAGQITGWKGCGIGGIGPCGGA
jgi:methylenetetrahydrofolate--tRNA-(uracil-5-)-methyltransferase